MAKKNKILLALFFVTAVVLISALASSLKEERFPYCPDCNVILISVDTLGANRLGLYGYERPTSPLVDELARAHGIVFENAIAQSHWTLPSHGSMLTGQYPQELGLWTVTDRLPPDTLTLAEALSEAGYTTRAISNGAFVQPLWGFDKGFDEFSGELSSDYWNDVPEIFEEASSWLEQNKRERFFLFLRPFHVHDPYLPTPDALQAIGVDPNSVSPVSIEDIVARNREEITQEAMNGFNDAHDAEIRELDWAFGNFWEYLSSAGFLKNTLVILTSDHGEEFGEHGTVGFHVSLYDELIHVPLVFFLPQARAMRLPEVAEVRSIPATVLDLLRLPQQTSFRGRSLVSWMLGERFENSVALSITGTERETALEAFKDGYENVRLFGVEVVPKPRNEEWEGTFALSARSSAWRLLKNHDGSLELYNLKRDPKEQENLMGSLSEFSDGETSEVRPLFQAIGLEL